MDRTAYNSTFGVIAAGSFFRHAGYLTLPTTHVESRTVFEIQAFAVVSATVCDGSMVYVPVCPLPLPYPVIFVPVDIFPPEIICPTDRRPESMLVTFRVVLLMIDATMRALGSDPLGQ